MKSNVDFQKRELNLIEKKKHNSYLASHTIYTEGNKKAERQLDLSRDLSKLDISVSSDVNQSLKPLKKPTPFLLAF